MPARSSCSSPDAATRQDRPKSTTAADRLSELGVSGSQARELVLTNLVHPGMIHGAAFEHGITLDMLAEIVGGGTTGLDVARFFAAHGVGAADLDQVPEGDELEQYTADRLSELQVTRDQVREFVFSKLTELHLIVDSARDHGITAHMVSDIMGDGAVGHAIAELVNQELQDGSAHANEPALVGLEHANEAALVGAVPSIPDVI